MDEPTLPSDLVEARRTPLFDVESLPEPLVRSHRTTVWAELFVQRGSVRFVDHEGPAPRDVRVEAGSSAVIAPGVEHEVEPATDASFFIQFYRERGADLVPAAVTASAPPDSPRHAGEWRHRGRDLDSVEEIVEMVTRQYADVVQDDLLGPYFDLGPDFMDWQALIGSVSDYWSHVLLYAPGYPIDVIESHRQVHDQKPFTTELFERWLTIFNDTVQGGWTGTNASIAQHRAAGVAWAMSKRLLGTGVRRPEPETS